MPKFATRYGLVKDINLDVDDTEGPVVRSSKLGLPAHGYCGH